MLSQCGDWVSIRVGGREAIRVGRVLLARTLTGGLDAIPALDDIGLEADGSRAAVELQEEATGIAENRAGLVAAPERSGAGGTVLTDRLVAASVENPTRRSATLIARC
jgi:hypothetical protein